MYKFTWTLLIAVLLNILTSLEAKAATHVAASCSNSDIQEAINASSNGDIVSVPAGSCSWKGVVSIPASKAITLQGAGIGATKITGGSIYMQTNAGSSNATRITGFSFTWADQNANYINIGDYTIQANNWRIDNCEFIFTTPGWWSNGAIWVKGWTFGLIDNCTFTGVARGVMVEPEISSYGKWQGDYAWTQPVDMGGPKAVYVENCIFNGVQNRGDLAIESRWGARYVFRYNTVFGYYAATHSGCTNQGRNPVSAEIYHNTFNSAGADLTSYRAIHIRTTGTALVFSNNINSAYQAGIEWNQEESANAGCGGPYAGSAKCSYPMFDGVGRIPPNQSLAPYYEWSNIKGGNATHWGMAASNCIGTNCTTDCRDKMVQSNRDYYTASAGDLAARPSTCNPNAAFFATDVGKQGTLYQCTATNTWSTYYTPFAYPHPLRQDEGGAGGSSGQSGSVPPPQNVRILN